MLSLPNKPLFSLWMIAALATTTAGIHSVAAAPTDEVVGLTIDNIRDNVSAAKANPLFSWKSNGERGYEEQVLVDITSDSYDLASELADKDAEVFEITGCLPSGHACSGWLKASSQPLAAEQNSALGAVRIVPVVVQTSEFTGSGVAKGAVVPLQIEKIRLLFPNLTGKRKKIGVISDSFNVLSGYKNDTDSGDLPKGIQVVKEGPPNGSDEGRAMMQLINDIAPDAELVFRTGFLGMADMALGIQELVEAGCDVIVDDITYPAESIYQNGIIAQAADNAAKQGVPYFTAAGNGDGLGYSSEWKPTDCIIEGEKSTCHDFSGDGEIKQRLNMSNDGTIIFLQWDAPSLVVPGGLKPDTSLDMVFYDLNGAFVVRIPFFSNNFAFNAVQFGEANSIDMVLVKTDNDMVDPTVFKWTTQPGWKDYITSDPPLNESLFIAHGNTANTAAVAAANEMQRFLELEVRPYSSSGGDPTLFDVMGNRLETPVIHKQPRFTGPDGSENTFFGLDNIFQGTSASAPNIAAVALLMLQINPNLKPDVLYKIMEDTAIDMNESGFDFTTGHGFVNGLQSIIKAEQMVLERKLNKPNLKKKKRDRIDRRLSRIEKFGRKTEVCYDY